MRHSLAGMKFALPALLCACALAGCSPNPTSGGKPLSEWVALLDDADAASVTRAIDAIEKVKPAQAGRAHRALSRVQADRERPAFLRVKATAALQKLYGAPGDIPIDQSLDFVFAYRERDFGDLGSVAAALAADEAHRSEILGKIADRCESAEQVLPARLLLARFGADGEKAALAISQKFSPDSLEAELYADLGKKDSE